MIGNTYREFKNVFSKQFVLLNNVLYYKNTYLYIPYHKELEEYDIYYLFFQFNDGIQAFNYYRKFYEEYEINCLCDAYSYIYKMSKHSDDIEKIKDKLVNIKNVKFDIYNSIAYNKSLDWDRKVLKNTIQLEVVNEIEKNIMDDYTHLKKLY